jgi:hypothetical protein
VNPEKISQTLDNHLPTAKINALCPNCHAPLHGKFCAKCGQNQQGMDRFFLSLVAEAFDNIFSLDSRTARTLLALLFRPGFLTIEYFAGRRARYIQPLRLYFIASLLFFLFLSLQNMLSEPPSLLIIDDATSTQDEQPNLGQVNTAVDDTTTKTQFDMQNNEPDQQLSADLTGQAAGMERVHEGIDEATTDIHFDTLTEKQNQQFSEDLTSHAAELERIHEGIDEATTDIHFDTLTEKQNQQLSKRLKGQFTKAATMGFEDPRTIIGVAIDIAPPILLLLLPFFAMALKLAYIGSQRYYTEHLILAVHNHCFVYLIYLVENALKPIETLLGSEVLPIIMICWMPLYMYLSLKKVYQQSYWLTAIKFLGLGVAYLLLFAIAFLISLLAGALTL